MTRSDDASDPNARAGDRPGNRAGSAGETAPLPAGDQTVPMASSEGRGWMGSGPHDAPDTIHRYRILEALGEGGFGMVYRAEQTEPVRREVAVKVIKPGMDSRQVVARFEAERQALALMDHPGVARVFDAGTTEQGRPYFVMELVRGEPITDYCDRHRLSVRDRVELMIRVCEAVQHAHLKGVIHRDLKPSNILVVRDGERATPKVIDFGIAKALDQDLTLATIHTSVGMMIGTPEYMSPEQAVVSGQDIDTRSDVYALGVLLYELLTGHLPFESTELRRAAMAEIQRIIREVDPPRPSTRLGSAAESASVASQRRTEVRSLSSVLRRDLDWVCMKCLEKDRERRYNTANALAQELQRYLSNEPVLAGPPSTAYKARKFVRRNRAGVIAASLVLGVLLAGLAGTSYGLVEADHQRDIAQREADAAKEAQAAAEAARAEEARRAEELQLVADFQAEQLGAIEPEVMGANIRRSLVEAVPEDTRGPLEDALAPINFTSIAMTTLEDNIFERTIEAIDTQFDDQPLVRAQLLQTTAGTLRDLGLLELATDPQLRAVAIRQTRLGQDHPKTIETVTSAGLLRMEQGQLSQAESYLREALDQARRTLGEDHPDTLAGLLNTGLLFQAQGDAAGAEQRFHEALQGFLRVLGEDHAETLKALQAIGASLRAQGRFDEAEPFLHEALEGHRRVLGEDHAETLNCMNSMAVLYAAQGRLAESAAFHLRVLDGRRRALGEDHPSTLQSLHNLGQILRNQGKLAEAEPHLREALERRRRVLGNAHADTLMSMSGVGQILNDQGRLEEAEPYYRQTLEGHRRVLGEDHPYTLTSLSNLGNLLSALGQFEQAERLLREALEGTRRVLGDDHLHTLIALNSVALVLEEQDKLDEADPYRREALERSRATLGDDHPSTLVSIYNMAAFQQERGELEEASALAEEAVRRGRAALGEDHWHVGVFLGRSASILAAMDRFADAEQRGLEAYAVLGAALGEAHDRPRRVARMLANLYDAWHQAEPDAGHDATAVQWRARLGEPQTDEPAPDAGG
ncbi:MAG: serine/threonine-protein kinase [Phycisphaerales bacterium]